MSRLSTVVKALHAVKTVSDQVADAPAGAAWVTAAAALTDAGMQIIEQEVTAYVQTGHPEHGE